MNAKFNKKVKSLHWWSHGYGVIILFAILVVSGNGWPLRRTFMSAFHKDEMIREYAYRATQDPQNLNKIVGEYKERIKSDLRQRKWMFNDGAGTMLVPKFEREGTEYDTMYAELLTNPDFFTRNVIPLIWREMPIPAIYKLDLPTKVDMKSFYKDGDRTPVYIQDPYGNREPAFGYCERYSLFREIVIFGLTLILIIILSGSQWIAIKNFSARHIKVAEDKEEYNPGKLKGRRIGVINLFIGIVIGISGILLLAVSEINLWKVIIYWFIMALPFVVLEFMTDPKTLFEKTGSELIDLYWVNSEIFVQPEVATFNWFVAIGENEADRKKKLGQLFLHKVMKARRDLNKRSKEFHDFCFTD